MDIFCSYHDILELKFNLRKRQNFHVCRVWHELERESITSGLHSTPKKERPREAGSGSSSGDFLAHEICRGSQDPGQDTQGGTLTACLVLCLCLCPQETDSNLQRTWKATEVRL